VALDTDWLEHALSARLPLVTARHSLSPVRWDGFAGYPAAMTGESTNGLALRPLDRELTERAG
jgi:hypothetical protein